MDLKRFLCCNGNVTRNVRSSTPSVFSFSMLGYTFRAQYLVSLNCSASQPRNMAEDDLEYYIKFPSPTPKDSTPSETEEFVFLYDEDKLPVVMLLGWAGCQDKYLSKYSAIYEERGCITVRYTAPVEYIFWHHNKMEHLAVRLLDLLSDMNLESHPIFFHIFSNGGAFLYKHISEVMQRNEKPSLNIKGAIFDSAPGERRFISMYRAWCYISGNTWYSNFAAFFISVIVMLHWVWEVVRKALLEKKKLVTDPILLVDEPFDWPQLFLYSRADKLIPAEDVEKFAEKRRQKGINVVAICFDDSPHVQHFLVHREIYINTVCSFLHMCLSDEESTTLPSAEIECSK